MRAGRFSITPRGLRRLGLAAASIVSIAALTGNALAGQATTPKLVGKASAGKSLFVTTCGVCHMLAPAKTVGTIGPNLTHVKLTEAKII